MSICKKKSISNRSNVSLSPPLSLSLSLYIYIYIYHTTCESIPCPHQPPTRGDNTVSVAQAGTATPGTTKQLLPPDRVGHWHNGLSFRQWRDLGSKLRRVIPKTPKMVLDATLLNTQHYKVRIMGKVEQSRVRINAPPTPWCSSYWKGSHRVTLDYGRKIYITFHLSSYT